MDSLEVRFLLALPLRALCNQAVCIKPIQGVKDMQIEPSLHCATATVEPCEKPLPQSPSLRISAESSLKGTRGASPFT